MIETFQWLYNMTFARTGILEHQYSYLEVCVRSVPLTGQAAEAKGAFGNMALTSLHFCSAQLSWSVR